MGSAKKTPTKRVHPDGKVSHILVGTDIEIHGTAKVRNGAVICDGVKIYSLVYVGENSVIGNHSILETGATVEYDAILGKGVIVRKFGRVSNNRHVPKGTIIESGEIY